ncbi:hypothetical protein CBS147353_3020 [Aspergillus niger]|uniref:branched-chain amino acid aminotransferase n=1 Tax=Aspergillus lacticoffeatus (strain CBS 101883) TaxID=1450533 RepID=UPI000D801CE0|nr:branched-chain-amino-acid aminotransferase [Aspergillus niger CBS 101883]KAI3081263.1 hypothetical protein CBS147353_3020 [Aspergillus niger]PYH58007.1 branched-chain-amino-acid aminotransferase [Aspergillus niger CBS 101883]GJP94894.1 branched-chain amino acid aminotransferase [Aspergillus niger]
MTTPFPPPPTPSIDWTNIGFKVRDVNYHVECTYTPQTHTWSTPQLIKSPHLSIHGLSPALNYGQQAYEGLKAFRHATTTTTTNDNSSRNGKITIFRPTLNATRLAHSSTILSIPPIPTPTFLSAVNLAVASNAEYVPPHHTTLTPTSGEKPGVSALYIRPLVFGSSPQISLTPPETFTFAVFVTPTGLYHGISAVDALILEEYDRTAPKGTGSAKAGGNYAPVQRHSMAAYKEGYGITLHLDSKTRTEVDEFSTSAFIGVKYNNNGEGEGKVTLVQPDSVNVIDSVTAASVLEIGEKMLGYTVEKRSVKYEEIREFDEVIAAGTAAGLVPVRSITMKSKGDKWGFECGGEKGEGGPVCRKLLGLLQGIQTGEVEDVFGWNWVVREVEGVMGEGEGVGVGEENAVNVP